ncbi:MAG: inositol monophosphatase [Flavobacteriales bacterium]|nr:inositol monophosphatase [Flavobacteriales bacterium]
MSMDLELLCEKVKELSREVGAFIKNEVKQVRQQDIETKSLNSLVSYVDKQAEEKIVQRLAQLLPGSGFIAEEGTSDKVGEIYNWIIDPLDGTTNFLHALPVYSVSIALQKHDEIVLGVVYEINQEECFYAWQGSDAYLNGTKISVSIREKLSDSLIATGFPYYDFNKLDAYFDCLKYLAKNTRGLRRMGSAAVDLAYVACGRFDAYFEYSLNAWDVAAGAFIVKQAGGKVIDFKGEQNWLFESEIVASSEKVQLEMEKIILKYMN